MRTKISILVFIISALAFFNISKAETDDISDLSDYYGFSPMETIKLDWDVKCLKTADFNGDSKNDIAIVNNSKARIELLLQKDTIGPDEEETGEEFFFFLFRTFFFLFPALDGDTFFAGLLDFDLIFSGRGAGVRREERRAFAVSASGLLGYFFTNIS